MLQALLHRKLDESTPDPQRLEDALTSTVFGVLVHVEAWKILSDWLGASPIARGITGDSQSLECWFWPRMEFAEPDVLLRMGDTLLVVEAKYRSGRHDVATDEEVGEHLGDQLLRQYKSVKASPAGRRTYARSLERAISECCLGQVFLVDARRMRRARREYEESKERLPTTAELRLVTWQGLYRLLVEPELSKHRWADDLKAYLRLTGLESFNGIGRRLPSRSDARLIVGWRAPRKELTRPRYGWSEVFHPQIAHGSASKAILAWASPHVREPVVNGRPAKSERRTGDG